jgi:hypothetical protein
MPPDRWGIGADHIGSRPTRAIAAQVGQVVPVPSIEHGRRPVYRSGWRHAAPCHSQFPIGPSVPDDRGVVVGEHTRLGRQIGGAVNHRPGEIEVSLLSVAHQILVKHVEAPAADWVPALWQVLVTSAAVPPSSGGCPVATARWIFGFLAPSDQQKRLTITSRGSPGTEPRAPSGFRAGSALRR